MKHLSHFTILQSFLEKDEDYSNIVVPDTTWTPYMESRYSESVCRPISDINISFKFVTCKEKYICKLTTINFRTMKMRHIDTKPSMMTNYGNNQHDCVP